MDDQPLITKYRPEDWDTYIGNEQAIAALQRVLKSSSARPHAYLFTGPSGIGKTTAARIIAKELTADVQEIDAASNSGVDAMRSIVEFSQYPGFGETGRRLLIIDECHALSKAAWQAILKLLEEPPSHLYLALCTTELAKVIETVKTRSYHVVLKPVPAPEIEDLLIAVADAEGWTVHRDIMQLAVRAATGQPRKGLAILQVIHDAPSAKEAERIISLQEASDPLIELLQHLVAGKKAWPIIQRCLAAINEQDDFEAATIGAGRYIITVMLNQQNEKDAARCWKLLDALTFPSETWDRKTSFMAAIGRMLWGDH